MGSQPYLTPRPFQADPNVSTACAASLIKSICFTFFMEQNYYFTICILFEQVREWSSPRRLQLIAQFNQLARN